MGGKLEGETVELTADACAALAEGEIRQRRMPCDPAVTHEESLDIITRKRALPIRAGAKIIGLMAGARLEDIDAVGEYGLNLGIAFQIVDDILDVVGEGARLGKRTGTDLREGNVTLVAIHALNDGSSIDVGSLARLIAKHRKREEDVRRGLALLRDSGAIEKARAEAFAFGQLAKKALDPIRESDAKANMVQLVDYVLSRDR